MKTHLNILYLEDDLVDSEYVEQLLLNAGFECKVNIVQTETKFLRGLMNQNLDLILADYSLPAYDGKAALDSAVKLRPEIPFIFVSGKMGEDAAIQSLLHGATDYVLKTKYSRLIPAVKRALKEAKEKEKRKAVEEALKESEAQYRSLFKDNHAVILLADPKTTKIIDANEAAVKFYGYTLEELKGNDLLQINMIEKEIFEKRFANILNGKKHHFYSQHKIKNGSIREVEMYTGLVHFAKNELLYLIIYDITDKKLAEKSVKESEGRFRNLFECAPVIIFTLSPQGTIMSLNPAFKLITGWEIEEWYGQPFFNLVHPDNIETAKRNFESAINGNIMPALQIRVKRKEEDAYLTAEITTTALFQDEKIVGLLGIGQDITQRKKSEQELITAKEKAEEANRLKTNFLHNMSHEIRTPMVGILGFAQILHESIADPELNLMVTMILDSGKRLMNTVNAILDLSRIEANKMEMHFKPVELFYEIEEIIKPLIIIANKKNLFLNTVLLNEGTASNLDTTLLQQILNNLVGNAIKFTNEGGVTIEIGEEIEEGKIWSVIKIIDTGIGIPEESNQIIFEEFRQASEGISRQYEGTGLGLTITKKLTELMKGEITFESKVGIGTTFRLKFPSSRQLSYKEVQNKPDKTIIEMPDIPGRNQIPNVLLVEDDIVCQQLTILFLQNICSIDLATNASAALQLVKQKKYDTILMDIHLGTGMNGLDTAHEIKKIPGYETIPIIALTAYAMKDEKDKFLSSGCTHYLSKPFEKKDLVNLIMSARNN